MPLAQHPGHGRKYLGGQVGFQIVQHQKVVSCAVHFPEFQNRASFSVHMMFYYNSTGRRGPLENVPKNMQNLLNLRRDG